MSHIPTTSFFDLIENAKTRRAAIRRSNTVAAALTFPSHFLAALANFPLHKIVRPPVHNFRDTSFASPSTVC
jgi:hypothetical protein